MAENTVFEGKKMTRRFLQLLQHSILTTIKRLDRLRDEHLFEKRFALAQSDERMIQAFQRNPENYVAVSEVRGYDEDVLKICEDNGIPYHYVDCRSFTENMGGDIIINSDDYPRLLELIKENNKDSIGGADDGDNSCDTDYHEYASNTHLGCDKCCNDRRSECVDEVCNRVNN